MNKINFEDNIKLIDTTHSMDNIKLVDVTHSDDNESIVCCYDDEHDVKWVNPQEKELRKRFELLQRKKKERRKKNKMASNSRKRNRK